MPFFVFCWFLVSLCTVLLGLISLTNLGTEFFVTIELLKFALMTTPFVFGVAHSVSFNNRYFRQNFNVDPSPSFKWDPVGSLWYRRILFGVWFGLVAYAVLFTERRENELWDFFFVFAVLVALGILLCELTGKGWANLVLMVSALFQSIATLGAYAVTLHIGLGKNPQSELGWENPAALVGIGIFSLIVWHALLAPYYLESERKHDT